MTWRRNPLPSFTPRDVAGEVLDAIVKVTGCRPDDVAGAAELKADLDMTSLQRGVLQSELETTFHVRLVATQVGPRSTVAEVGDAIVRALGDRLVAS